LRDESVKLVCVQQNEKPAYSANEVGCSLAPLSWAMILSEEEEGIELQAVDSHEKEEEH
jgi:hypothetical protein